MGSFSSDSFGFSVCTSAPITVAITGGTNALLTQQSGDPESGYSGVIVFNRTSVPIYLVFVPVGVTPPAAAIGVAGAASMMIDSGTERILPVNQSVAVYAQGAASGNVDLTYLGG